MHGINRLAAALMMLGVAGGPILAQAQTQEPPAAQKDESKMDPKGVPGSPSTQGGKSPEGTSGSSSDSSSGASAPGESRAAKTPEEVTQSRDESKMDAKGIPGSTDTQGGPAPSTSK